MEPKVKYINKVYKAISDSYNESGFNLSEEDFKTKLLSNDGYRAKIHSALEQSYKDSGFNLNKKQFDELVSEAANIETGSPIREDNVSVDPATQPPTGPEDAGVKEYPDAQPAEEQKESYEDYKARLNEMQPGLGNEVPNYNLQGAYEGGLEPTKVQNEDGSTSYHLGSRNPVTGEILKSEDHPTFQKAVEGEEAAGYKMYKKDGKWYSQKEFEVYTPEQVKELESQKKSQNQIPSMGFGPGVSTKLQQDSQVAETNEAIDSQIQAHSPEGEEIYNKVKEHIQEAKFDYFTSPKTKQSFKESLMEEYGHMNERAIDEILGEVEFNHKNDAFYDKGINDYSDKFDKTVADRRAIAEADVKAFLEPTEEERQKYIDGSINYGVKKYAKDLFNEEERTKSDIVKRTREMYSTTPPEEQAEKEGELREEWASAGFKPEEFDGWLSTKTGMRNSGETATEEDKVINGYTEQYVKVPADQLKEIIKKNFTALQGLEKEYTDVTKQMEQYASRTGVEAASSTDPQQKAAYEFSMAALENLQDRAAGLRGDNENLSEINQSKHKLEAALRAYYLNQDPKKYKGTSVTDFFKSIGKGFLEEVVPFVGQKVAQEAIGSTEADLQTGLKTGAQEADFDLTEEETAALESTLGEKIAPQIGGVGGVILKFAALTAAENMAGVGALISSMRTGNRIQMITSGLLRAAVEDVKFQVGFGAKPGEGALFTGLMGGASKLFPFLKAKQGEHFAKQWAKEMGKTSASLTTASNASKIVHSFTESMVNDKDFKYEMEKNFGANRSERFDNLMGEMISNSIFGVQGIIRKGIYSKRHILENLTELHKEFENLNKYHEENSGSRRYDKEQKMVEDQINQIKSQKFAIEFPEAEEVATKEKAKLTLDKVEQAANYAGEKEVAEKTKKVKEEIDDMPKEEVQAKVKEKMAEIKKEFEDKKPEAEKPVEEVIKELPEVEAIDTEAEVIETKIKEDKETGEPPKSNDDQISEPKETKKTKEVEKKPEVEKPIESKESQEIKTTKEATPERIKAVFPETKVTEPVYHVTDQEFTKFDKDKVVTGGFYFTKKSPRYAGVIKGKERAITAIVNLKNPLTKNTEYISEAINDWELIERLKKEGYDGIIDDDGHGEVIVFSSEAIHIVDSREITEEDKNNNKKRDKKEKEAIIAKAKKQKQMDKHNKLVQATKQYNKLTPAKQKSKAGRSLLNKVHNLAKKISTDKDKYTSVTLPHGVKVQKNGKQLRTWVEKTDPKEVQQHKTIKEYEDKGFQDFVEGISNNPEMITALQYFGEQQKTALKKQAIRDIVAGKKSVQSNYLLDTLEKYYNLGYIELVENKLGVIERYQIPIEDLINTMKEQTPYEEMTDEQAENMLSDFEDVGQEVTLENLPNLKESFFNGVIYTNEDYEILKKYLENEQQNKEGEGDSQADTPETNDSKSTRESEEEVSEMKSSSSKAKKPKLKQETDKNKDVAEGMNLEMEDDPETGRSHIELPELVALAKALVESDIDIRKNLNDALGAFAHKHKKEGSGKILLWKELFKADKDGNINVKAIEAVLAHEMGHLIDFLPDSHLKRGNILGRIIGAREAYKMDTAGKDKQHHNPLTKEDEERLSKEAKEQLDEEAGNLDDLIIEEIVKTPIWEDAGLTADDVVKIWNDVESREKYPELYNYVARLAPKEKLRILKLAAKGLVDEIMAGKFGKRIVGYKETKVEKTVKGKKQEVTPDDVKSRLEDLIAEEIRKRKLFTIKEITDELVAVTQWKRPFNPKQDREYTKYRRSAKELYADAVGLLLNNPKKLRELAPKFTEMYFAWFEEKNDVKQAYQETLDLISKGEIHETRRAKAHESFDLGHKKRTEAANKRAKEVKGWTAAKHLLISSHSPLLDNIPKRPSPDTAISWKHKTEDAIRKMSYARDSVALLVKDANDRIIQPIIDAGISINDLGYIGMLNRNLGETDRKGVANPWGYQGDINKQEIENTLKNMTPEQRKIVDEKLKEFHDLVWPHIEKAHEAGLFSDEVWENKIVPNKDTYMTFGVVDYITKATISAVTPGMKGTLKEVENPLYSTMAKVTGLINETLRQNAFKAVKEAYDEHHPGTITDITPRKFEQARMKDPINNREIKAYVDGKLRIFEAPKEIAEGLSPTKTSASYRALLTKALPLIPLTNFFKRAVTTYNPGFMFIGNPLRDHQRTLNNMAVVLRAQGKLTRAQTIMLPFTQYTPAFFRATVSAFKFATGNWDAMVRNMIEDGVLFTNAYERWSEEDGQDLFRPLLIASGILQKDKVVKEKPEGPIKSVSDVAKRLSYAMGAPARIYGETMANVDDKLSTTNSKALLNLASVARVLTQIPKVPVKIYKGAGTVAELTSKILAYDIYNKHFDRTSAAYYTRKLAGTPDARDKGIASSYLEPFFPFLNMIMQDLRTSTELASDSKTAKAWWVLHGTTAMLPGILLGFFASLWSILNDIYDEDEIQKNPAIKKLRDASRQYSRIPARDRLNYLSVPITTADNGDPVYLRVPLGETVRLFFATSQYMTEAAITGNKSGWKQTLSVGEGLTPSMSPMIEVMKGMYTYGIEDEVPVDSYWGYPIMSKTDMVDKSKSRAKMLKWTAGKFGLYPLVQKWGMHDLRKQHPAFKFNTDLMYLNRVLRQGSGGDIELANFVKKQVSETQNKRLGWLKDRVLEEVTKAELTGGITDLGKKRVIATELAIEFMEKYDMREVSVKQAEQLVQLYMDMDGSSPYSNVIKALTLTRKKEKIAILKKIQHKFRGDIDINALLDYLLETGTITKGVYKEFKLQEPKTFQEYIEGGSMPK